MDTSSRSNHNVQHLSLKAVTMFALLIALLIALSACDRPGRPSATDDDYVGIWACYESHADSGKVNYEIGKNINQLLVINKDRSARYIITFDGADPQNLECRWRMTTESKSAGTDSGIALEGGNFENPFTYYDTGSQPMEMHFTGKRLVKGNLVVDYGNRKDYFEKVSNDPSDPVWITPAIANETASSTGSGIPNGAISWTEASQHIGETVTVYGPVKDSSYLSESNHQPTYVDIGAAYPDSSRVSMVVWGEDRGNFPSDPESMYLGKTICVTGKLYEYDGAAYMKVATSDQVNVLD